MDFLFCEMNPLILCFDRRVGESEHAMVSILDDQWGGNWTKFTVGIGTDNGGN